MTNGNNDENVKKWKPLPATFILMDDFSPWQCSQTFPRKIVICHFHLDGSESSMAGSNLR
jgi:hypothetical protein